MTHQCTRDELTKLSDRLPPETMAGIGKVTATWALLEAEFDLALQCLLAHRKASGLHDDPLLITFAKRLGLIRQAAKRVYPSPIFIEFNRLLGKIASVHDARDSIVHARLVPLDDRRFTAELHRHWSRGQWTVSVRVLRFERLAKIADQIADTAARLISFNRRHLPGRPASWLDIRPPSLGKPARTLPESMQDHPERRRQKEAKAD